MFELLAVAHKSHHFLRLNVSFKSDLKWLDFFCFRSMVCHLGGYWSSRAGTSALPLPSALSCSRCRRLWCYFKWSESLGSTLHSLKKESILFQELLPIIFA